MAAPEPDYQQQAINALTAMWWAAYRRELAARSRKALGGERALGAGGIPAQAPGQANGSEPVEDESARPTRVAVSA